MTPQHPITEARYCQPMCTTPLTARRAPLAAVAVLAMALLGGCLGTSDPVAFYVIEALPGKTIGAAPAPLTLGLGTVALPALLDRPQIVTQLDPNQVELSEHHRWAGELADNVRRVLAQNLASRVTGVDVVARPTARLRPDLGVELSFVQFGGQLGRGVRLEGHWRLFDGRAGCRAAVPSATPFAIDIATAGPGYAEFVAALRQGVGQLSDLLAVQVLVAARCGG